MNSGRWTREMLAGVMSMGRRALGVALLGLLTPALMGQTTFQSDVIDRQGLVWTMGGDFVWVVDTTTKLDLSSARVGTSSRPSMSWIRTTIPGPAKLSFKWKLDSSVGIVSADYCSLVVDGTEVRSKKRPEVFKPGGWESAEYDITQPGDHKVEFQYWTPISFWAGTSAFWIDSFVAFTGDTSRALNGFTGLPYAWEGGNPWLPDTGKSQDGLALKSGPTADDGSSAFQIANVPGGQTVSWKAKVSSEPSNDLLRCYTNGVEVTGLRLSGEVDWTSQSVTLPAGTWTLKWVYQKDQKTAKGSDAAWLDSMSFTYLPVVANVPSAVTAAVGGTLKLKADGGGGPGTTIAWLRNGVALTNGGRFSGVDTLSLTVANVDQSDEGAYAVRLSNSAGTSTSTSATLTVPVLPTITGVSTNLTVAGGQPFQLSVSAKGSQPLTYQWSLNGTPISGATGASYSVVSASALQGGAYTVVVSNPYGSASSPSVAVTVNAPPFISTQPSGLSVTPGKTAVLSVAAASSLQPVTYSWRKDGVALTDGTRITGSATAQLSVSGIISDDTGSYSVVVSNPAGSVTSANATVTVVPFNNAPTLNDIPALTRAMNGAASVVSLSGIADGNGGTQGLTVTATSSDPSLVPDPTVTYTSPQSTGTLSVTSAANRFGTAIVTVRVKDNGGTVDGGVDTVQRQFVVTVVKVNFSPTLDPLSSVTMLENGFVVNSNLVNDFSTAQGGLLRGNATFISGASGRIQLTPSQTTQSGGFFLSDLDPGQSVVGFRAQFRMVMDQGTSPPADGVSFNFMPEDTSSVTLNNAEQGIGTGLSVGFGIHTSQVFLRAGGVLLATKSNYQAYGVGSLTSMPLVEVSMSPDRKVTVIHNGTVLFDQVQTTLQPTAGWRFGWAARTGGSYARHSIDDLSIMRAVVSASPISLDLVNDFSTAHGGQLRGDASFVSGASGRIQVTPAENWKSGGFSLPDLDLGQSVTAFTAQFRMLMDQGTTPPADGLSFNFMPEDPGAVTLDQAEQGVGTGLSVGFGIYSSQVVLKAGGVVLATKTSYQAHGVGSLASMPLVVVTMTSDRKVSVTHNGTVLFDKVQTTLQPTSGWRFAWAGRTGGSNARQSIDDVTVSRTTGFSENFTTKHGGVLRGNATHISGTDGRIQLNPAVNQQKGGFFLPDLDPGQAVASFKARFRMLMDQGTTPPADGVSFNFIPEDAAAVSLEGAEQGVGTGLSVGFGIYSSQVVLKAGGVLLATKSSYSPYGVGSLSAMPLVEVTMTTDGKVTVTHNGTVLFDKVQTTLKPTAGWRFGWASRTGGSNARQSIDDVTIERTYLAPVAMPADVAATDFSQDFTTEHGGLLRDNATFISGTSGRVQLTPAVNAQKGSFFLQDLDPGKVVTSFTARFKMLMDSGTSIPADGMSFNFLPNDPATVVVGDAEKGIGTGLSVGFGIYTLGPPQAYLAVGGTSVATTPYNAYNIGSLTDMREVVVTLTSDMKVTVTYNGVTVFDKVQTTLKPATGWRFGWAARTGGLNARQTIDDVKISRMLAGSSTASLPPVATAITVPLTGIGDGDGGTQTLKVTATSSNPSVIGTPALRYTSPQSSGAMAFTTTPTNAAGSVVLTVKVQDTGGTALGGVDTIERQLAVTVLPINDPPTLDAIPNIAVTSTPPSQQVVNLTGIGTGVETGQTITITASSSDTTIIPTPSVQYTAGASTGTLQFTPVTNKTGTVVVTVTAKDNGGTNYWGSDTLVRQFSVAVGPVPPSITTAPADLVVQSGFPASFSVTASGLGLTYKWFKNGTEIPGATNTTYSLASVAATDAAAYRVQVFNSNTGNVYPTATAYLSVVQPPTRTAVWPTQQAQFTAQVSTPTGLSPSYQWFKDGIAISGSTSSSLTIPSATLAAVANYSLRVNVRATEFTTTPVTLRLLSSLATLFNTGVDNSGVRLRDRSSDPHYTLIDPSPITGSAVAVVSAGQYPTPPWIEGGTKSAWISPSSRLIEAGMPFVYRTTFDLTGIDLNTVRIAGQVAADDTVSAIRLNGVDLPAVTGIVSNAFKSFDFQFTNTRGADRFVDRGILPSVTDLVAAGDTTGASSETGEPWVASSAMHGTAGSIWWRWVAPTNGQFFVRSTGSTIPIILGVFEGAELSTPTLLAGSAGGGGDPSIVRVVSFSATAGREYQLYVDGLAEEQGAVGLELRLQGSGAIGADAFANRGAVGNTFWKATAFATNTTATVETGEPPVQGGKTVWWKWTAPKTGTVSIDTHGSTFDTVLWVYSGSVLSSLTQVASNDDDWSGFGNTSLVTFTAVSGTEYQIRVADYGDQGGSVLLNITTGTEPALTTPSLSVLPTLNTLDFVVTNTTDAGRDRSLTGLRVEFTNTPVVVHPVILAQGPEGGVQTFGERKVFTATAQTGGTTSYQWYKDDLVIDGATESTLIYNRVEESDAGAYKVRIENGNGVVWSQPANFLVDVPLRITHQPLDRAVALGGTTTLSLRFRGNAPLSVQWYLNDRPIPDATSTNLTLTSVTVAHAGSYRAEVKDRDDTLESDVAELWVVEPPMLVQQPQDLAGVERVAAMRMETVVDGTQPMRFTWYRNNVPLAVENTNVLSLGLLRESHVGSYYLVATNLAGSVTSRLASVTVQQPPSIASASGDAKVDAGGAASFSVRANGSGSLTYRWYIGGGLQTDVSGSVLQLTNLTAAVGTEVAVVVGNAFGEVTNKFRLDVFPPPVPVLSTGHAFLQEVRLKPGWNAMFLLVQPDDNLVGNVFTNIPYTSVWRWSDPGNGPKFVADQSETELDTTKWQVHLPPANAANFQNNLMRVFRHEAYLVHLGGTQEVVLSISGKPGYQKPRWATDGYTLSGFPVEPADADPASPGQFLPGVTVAQFLWGSEAHYDRTAGAPRGLFRLGSDGVWSALGATNELRSGEAYWVYTRGSSDFVAPVELSFQGITEMTFGLGGADQQMQVSYRDSSTQAGALGNATLGHILTDQSLPLKVSEFTPQEGSQWRDLPNSFPISARGYSRRTIRLAPARARVQDLVYQGIVEVKGGGAIHRIPLTVERDEASAGAVAAVPFNPVGLWVGTVSITHVSEVNGVTTNYVVNVVTNVVDGVTNLVQQASTQVKNVVVGSRPTPVRDPFDLPILLHADMQGVCRLLQQVTLLSKPPALGTADPGGQPVLLTDSTTFSQYQGVAARGRDLVGRRFSTPFFPMSNTNGIPFDETFALGRTMKARWVLGSEATVNPFKHRYHPDHDNLDASFRVFKAEAYAVTRTVTLSVSEGQGSTTNPSMGHDEIEGIYEEVVEGLHRTPITARGTFHIKRILSVGALDNANP